jgi:hypothetical protein
MIRGKPMWEPTPEERETRRRELAALSLNPSIRARFGEDGERLAARFDLACLNRRIAANRVRSSTQH